MPWGAAIAAAGGIYAANQSAGAAANAAKGQQQAANLSYQDQLALMRQQRRDAAPYRDAGYNALNQLNYLMGLGDPTAMAQTQNNFDPAAYKQWRIQQMTDTVNSQFKNPQKAAQVIARRTELISKAMDNPANAWADYVTRSKTAPNKTQGDFWAKRDPSQGAQPGQSGSEYGFLQKRFNNQEFEKDPGYQFRMDEGARAVDSGAAARNGLLSGAAMKAMQKYGQGFASNEYGNAYNRFTGDQQNMYNRLAGISGTGQQQMNQTNQMQSQGLNNAAGYMQDAAAARASGIVGANNARQSGYSGFGNVLTDAIKTYQSGGMTQQEKYDLNKYKNPSGYDTGGMITDYGNS